MLESMEALGKSSGRRDCSPMEKVDADISPAAGQMTGAGSWRGVCLG